MLCHEDEVVKISLNQHGTYIDGFAGPQDPNLLEAWSARLVLASEPRWLRKFFFCDIGKPQYEALRRLRAEMPPRRPREPENAGGRNGIDPQPGRLPAVAKFRAPDSEVRQRVSAKQRAAFGQYRRTFELRAMTSDRSGSVAAEAAG